MFELKNCSFEIWNVRTCVRRAEREKNKNNKNNKDNKEEEENKNDKNKNKTREQTNKQTRNITHGTAETASPPPKKKLLYAPHPLQLHAYCTCVLCPPRGGRGSVLAKMRLVGRLCFQALFTVPLENRQTGQWRNVVMSDKISHPAMRYSSQAHTDNPLSLVISRKQRKYSNRAFWTNFGRSKVPRQPAISFRQFDRKFCSSPILVRCVANSKKNGKSFSEFRFCFCYIRYPRRPFSDRTNVSLADGLLRQSKRIGFGTTTNAIRAMSDFARTKVKERILLDFLCKLDDMHAFTRNSLEQYGNILFFFLSCTASAAVMAVKSVSFR